jgi:choline dehydrogenase-like flavoprotein
MAQMTDEVSTFEYIIIGGGTSGAVAARRLAEANANFSVCLLEAGPRYVYLYKSIFYLK